MSHARRDPTGGTRQHPGLDQLAAFDAGLLAGDDQAEVERPTWPRLEPEIDPGTLLHNRHRHNGFRFMACLTKLSRNASRPLPRVVAIP